MKKFRLIFIPLLLLTSCNTSNTGYVWDVPKDQSDYFRREGSLTFTYRNYDDSIIASKNFVYYDNSFKGSVFEGVPTRPSENGFYYSFDSWYIVSSCINQLKTSYSFSEVKDYFKETGYSSRNYKQINIDVYAIYNQFTFEEIMTTITADSGVAVSSNQNFKMKEFALPETYDSKPIVGLLPKSFYNNTLLECISLPNSITNIGDFSFYNNSNLSHFNIPDSLERIGFNAFEKCTNLHSITLTDNIINLEASSFASSGLINFSFGNSNVNTIGKKAFSDCQSLTNVTLNQQQKNIGAESFSNCSSLKSIVIQNKAAYVYEKAFYKCTSLESFTLPQNGTHIIYSSAFEGDTNLANVNIKDVLWISINSYAFKNCTSLREIILPSNTQFGAGIFYGCSKDLKVFYLGKSSINIPTNYSEGFEGTLYVYSENEPTEFGNYWHYVNGQPEIW